MKRPLTPLERQREETLKRWALALLVGHTLPLPISGSWRYGCPRGAECSCGLIHVHYHTNHEGDRLVRV